MCPTPTDRKPGRPKNPEHTAARTAEILAAAAAEFAAVGYAAADIQAVADRVGIGKATVYRYFPTKEVLFLATVRRGLDELTAVMNPIVADTAVDPFAQVRQAVTAYLQFFADQPELAELFIQERAAFRGHHVPLYFDDTAEETCQHQQFFARLAATGRLRPITQERFFQVLGDLLYGTILTNLLTGRPAAPREQADAILDIVFHGLLTPTGRRTPKGGK
jgi:AcrR family transcriptional regulator